MRTLSPKSTLRTRKVHGTYQLSATLETHRVQDVEERFIKARGVALKWMSLRLKRELGQGFSLGQAAWKGEDFDIDKHGQLYAAVSLPDLGLWTCRIEHHKSFQLRPPYTSLSSQSNWRSRRGSGPQGCAPNHT
jgi:hypothetical protein